MNNEIVGNIKYNNASINFKGENNKFICKGNLNLKNCKIRFTGNNSLIYIDENDYPISLDMKVGNDSVIYFGKDCYVNQKSYLYATERKNIIIGDKLLLSFETYFRVVDSHIICDCVTKKRINFSKSILVGDKVWIGQQSLILKGTVIGSGAIIGGHSVVANKTIKSNSLYAGNPAKKIRENVFCAHHKSTNDFSEKEERDSEVFKNGNEYVYEKDETTTDLKKIDKDLMSLKTVEEKIKYIEKNIVNNNHKNRFYQE